MLTSDETDILYYGAKLIDTLHLKTGLPTHRVVALVASAAYIVGLRNGSDPDELIADVALLVDAGLDCVPCDDSDGACHHGHKGNVVPFDSRGRHEV